jgi:hypothetical protein
MAALAFLGLIAFLLMIRRRQCHREARLLRMTSVALS